MKVFLVILIFLILTSNGSAFGRRKFSRYRDNEHFFRCALPAPRNDRNETSIYVDGCDPTKFGIVQKIPYLGSCPTCDTIEIDFSTACVRCGMCLAIADKINQTLEDVHEMLSSFLNDTEIELLLRTICDHSFQYYSLREIDGKNFICDWIPGSTLVSTSADGLWPKKLRDLCHYYLDEIGELQLYEDWQKQWKDDNELYKLSNILCRNMNSMLHDCRSIKDSDTPEPLSRAYNVKVKFKASNKHCKRNC